MAIFSHNVELMQEWAFRMDDNSRNYDALIDSLYSLVHQFAGSGEFKGGLSTDFEENLNRLKPEFDRYSETFRECIKYINERADAISDAESVMANKINNENLLG